MYVRMNVILSIRPTFCKMIFSGQKKYEYRKRVFTRSDVDKVYIYATKPICRIVGYFTIDTVIAFCTLPYKPCNNKAPIASHIEQFQLLLHGSHPRRPKPFFLMIGSIRLT